MPKLGDLGAALKTKYIQIAADRSTKLGEAAADSTSKINQNKEEQSAAIAAVTADKNGKVATYTAAKSAFLEDRDGKISRLQDTDVADAIKGIADVYVDVVAQDSSLNTNVFNGAATDLEKKNTLINNVGTYEHFLASLTAAEEAGASWVFASVIAEQTDRAGVVTQLNAMRDQMTFDGFAADDAEQVGKLKALAEHLEYVVSVANDKVFDIANATYNASGEMENEYGEIDESHPDYPAYEAMTMAFDDDYPEASEWRDEFSIDGDWEADNEEAIDQYQNEFQDSTGMYE